MLRNSLVLVSLVSLTAVAHAQGAAGAPAEPAADPVATPAAADPTLVPVAPTPPAPESQTPQTAKGLRNGFSLSVGQEFGTTMAGQSFSGQLYGVDWRIGARFSEAISVYLHSHISFGTVGPDQGGGGGVTGNIAGAVVAEYMLPMRLFAGAGAGYGVLNNPNGPLVEARAGYYPFKTNASGKARRLNVALDARWYMVGDQIGTVTQLSLSLGYDRF
ncbi:MAG TPA: hypothetical protein VMZ53_16645 [Kofleriaceae bacterium]|nr:hypothetical protein [Kofleriaceae bacterium]